jgi:hypothetical protein
MKLDRVFRCVLTSAPSVISLGAYCNTRILIGLVVLAALATCEPFGTVAFGQELVWAKSAGGPVSVGQLDLDRGWGIAVDRAGNTYVTGSFEGVAKFGSGDSTETTLTSSANSDVFVAKYDRRGTLVWAKQAGGDVAFPSNVFDVADQGRSIAVDEGGNSYVTGQFSGAATFGLGDANETVLVSAGNKDIFLVKYDPDGQLIWAAQAGGTGYDLPASVAIDRRGRAYITGFTFSPVAVFGAGEANETAFVMPLGIFVAKYDSNGALIWARQAGGADDDRGNAISVDDDGNSYVTGFIVSATATFGPGEDNEVRLSATRQSRMFVAKYDESGSLLWAKQQEGEGAGAGLSIGVDRAGTSYVAGFFSGIATFGAGEENQTALIGGLNGSGHYLARYDRNGSFLGATHVFLGSGPISAIAIDPAGRSYITGQFRGVAVFGVGEVNETVLTSTGNNAFVAHISRDGELVWVRQAGGNVDGQAGRGTAIAIDKVGNSYVVGEFGVTRRDGTAVFGLGERNETILTSAGGFDVFVAKYQASRPRGLQ